MKSSLSIFQSILKMSSSTIVKFLGLCLTMGMEAKKYGGLRIWILLRFLSFGFKCKLSIFNTINYQVPEDKASFLYSGDCYVILYTGEDGKNIVYFWQGNKCSIDEKGASAIHAARIDNEDLGGKAMQVKIDCKYLIWMKFFNHQISSKQNIIFFKFQFSDILCFSDKSCSRQRAKAFHQNVWRKPARAERRKRFWLQKCPSG